LADCLAAVICQRLRYDARLGIRLPECEVLMPTHAVKNFIRRTEFFQIASVLETGADHGMWTFTRYRNWMANRRDWVVPEREGAEVLPDEVRPAAAPLRSPSAAEKTPERAVAKRTPASTGTRIEIDPDESEFGKILKR
jgi:twitching motility protein PilT